MSVDISDASVPEVAVGMSVLDIVVGMSILEVTVDMSVVEGTVDILAIENIDDVSVLDLSEIICAVDISAFGSPDDGLDLENAVDISFLESIDEMSVLESIDDISVLTGAVDLSVPGTRPIEGPSGKTVFEGVLSPLSFPLLTSSCFPLFSVRFDEALVLIASKAFKSRKSMCFNSAKSPRGKIVKGTLHFNINLGSNVSLDPP